MSKRGKEKVIEDGLPELFNSDELGMYVYKLQQFLESDDFVKDYKSDLYDVVVPETIFYGGLGSGEWLCFQTKLDTDFYYLQDANTDESEAQQLWITLQKRFGLRQDAFATLKKMGRLHPKSAQGDNIQLSPTRPRRTKRPRPDADPASPTAASAPVIASTSGVSTVTVSQVFGHKEETNE